MNQFKAANRELIKTDIFILFNTRDRGDVPYLSMLRLFEILQDSPTGNDAILKVFHTKAFQIFYVEMLQQFLFGCLVCKHPVIELESKEFIAENPLEILLPRPIIKHLLGREVCQKFFYVIVSSFASQKFACRDIEECYTTSHSAEMNCCKEVVLLIVQHIIRHGNTRRHQFGDAAFYELLRQFRIFQLIADGYALASSDEFRQISIEGVMGKSRHLITFIVTIVTMCQRDTQYLCCCHSILAIGLIEVTTTKQQHRIWVLRLQVEELFHHRGEFTVFLCHLFVCFKLKVGICRL